MAKKGNNNNRRNSNRSNRSDRQSREVRGTEQLLEDKAIDNESYHLNWFKPNHEQKRVVKAVDYNVFTVITGDSGSGKSTTALWKALNDLQGERVDQLIFVKTPSEGGDDMLGFLSGDEDQKLLAHFETTKTIIEQFMTPAKLNMELKGKSKRIKFTIPNFIQGATFTNAIVIIDEAQNISPNTLKLLTERVGVGSKYILLGDSQQKYAIKKRRDGLATFLDLVDQDGDSEGYVEHIELETIERSEGSAYISRIFKGYEG